MQLRELGLRHFARFKVQRLRARRVAPGTPLTIHTPLGRHALVMRAGTSDAHVFSQIYVEREYRCLDDVPTADLVVDCGANVGYASSYFLSRYPTARVVSVEPEPGNYATLVRNVEPYGDRSTTIQAGVWSSSVGLVVEEAEPGQGREWAVTVREARDDEAPSVMAVDLATILRDSGAERISILKVDIEGSEAEVFSRHTDGWIDRVDNLVVELHGDRCREVVLAAMEGRGFEVSECDELTVFKRPRSTN